VIGLTPSGINNINNGFINSPTLLCPASSTTQCYCMHVFYVNPYVYKITFEKANKETMQKTNRVRQVV